mgnify:CR=1 FL=1
MKKENKEKLSVVAEQIYVLYGRRDTNIQTPRESDKQTIILTIREIKTQTEKLKESITIQIQIILYNHFE